MAYIQPNSIVQLFKGINLDNRYMHTIYFANASAQNTWFTGKVYRTYQQQSYTRYTRNQIKLAADTTELLGVTYLRFMNDRAVDKWFYAFVNAIEYLNEGTALITYEIDVMQTWFMQGGSIRPCMVEREHVSDDTFGTNLEDEPVGSEVYDYDEIVKSGWFNTFDVIVSASSEPTNEFKFGLYCGTDLYCIPCNNQTQAGVITSKIQQLLGGNWDKNQQSADIVDLYTFPHEFTNASAYENMREVVVAHPANFDSYTPKNNKMYTYPFSYLFVTTHNGDSDIYRWEFWDGNNLGGNVYFGAYGNPLGGGMITCFPKAYNGIIEDFDAGLVIDNFPKNSANVDAYQAWIAAGGQTRLNNAQEITTNRKGATIANAIGTGLEQAAGITMDLFKGAKSAAKGDVAKAGASFVSAAGGAAHIVGTTLDAYADVKEAQNKIDYQFADAKYVPNIIIGKNTPSIGAANHTMEFYFYHAHIRADEAKRVDDFLTMFGYATNRIKQPNLTGRAYWNFVKTQNAVIAGDMPASSKEAIGRIFDGGITFWHNGDNVGNYLVSTSQGTANNPIV